MCWLMGLLGDESGIGSDSGSGGGVSGARNCLRQFSVCME